MYHRGILRIKNAIIVIIIKCDCDKVLKTLFFWLDLGSGNLSF